MEKIKEIDILVYPDFDADELKTKTGQMKFNNWLKEIELLKNKQSTILLVDLSQRKENKEEMKKLFELIKHKNLKNKVFITNNKKAEEIVSLLKSKFKFSNNINIRGFGMHYNYCIVNEMSYYSKIFKKLIPNIKNINKKQAKGLSVKLMGHEFDRLLFGEKENIRFHNSKEARKIRDLLRSGRLNPVQIAHGISRGITFNQRYENIINSMKTPIVKKFRKIRK
jgi:hypothetical protein